MDTGSDARQRIISLHLHTNKTQREISEAMSVPQSTVSDIIQSYKRTGSAGAQRKGKCGRKRKTSKRADARIVRSSLIDPRLNAVDLKRELNLAVSRETVARRLREAGRRARKPFKKPLLTKKMQAARLQWAQEHATWTQEDWSKVIFSDESTFEVTMGAPRYVRVGNEPLSPRHCAQRMKHPPKVMIWGCMSIHGMGRIHVVEGNMNSVQYITVLERRLIPQVQSWNLEEYIFQQDSAPCHTSRVVKQFFIDHGIQVLPWAGNSPDMNPIETLWAVLKRKLQETTFTNKIELIGKLLDFCMRDTEQKAELDATCRKLVEGMPARVKMLLNAKGGHTRL